MRRKMAYDLIIRNALLKDGDLPVDIGMKDGYIKDIGGIQGECPAHKVLDAENKIVVPAFVNAHTHLDKADLLSKMKPSQFGGTLEENRLLVRKFKENYTHSGIKTRAGQVVKEMICHGVTAISTQVDVDPLQSSSPWKPSEN